MSLSQKAKELAGEIKLTVEFAELKQAKAEVEKDRNLKIQLESFNRKQAELFSSRMSEKEFESRTGELNKKLSELLKTREVDVFLKASKRFNDLMSKVYKQLGESIEAGLN